ncbi:helix-turn-helix transcriptional regulator [Paenibacillus sp. Marseille-P2973]|uniref:helix-turn-helix transcriptional regulator n=1 Tax=Paenibacillus sp. Marseille-P2973 TaxID=1871032 RepID=UPI001FFD8947|nr:helix-turn-helix transcriptional regulator [Paenibacillus sp. Marseille-P2973]
MKELIAKRLLELRGDSSREATAKAIGISVSALQMYENAQRIPKDSIKVRIATHFDKTVQEIFFDDQPHKTCFLDSQSATSEQKEVG